MHRSLSLFLRLSKVFQRPSCLSFVITKAVQGIPGSLLSKVLYTKNCPGIPRFLLSEVPLRKGIQGIPKSLLSEVPSVQSCPRYSRSFLSKIPSHQSCPRCSKVPSVRGLFSPELSKVFQGPSYRMLSLLPSPFAHHLNEDVHTRRGGWDALTGGILLDGAGASSSSSSSSMCPRRFSPQRRARATHERQAAINASWTRKAATTAAVRTLGVAQTIRESLLDAGREKTARLLLSTLQVCKP
ncbi:hypothetical protein V5799_031895 [Amblyomma americanum]|uniref:Uncharacterized protein n=1 Tax=Amblyomma americanum TaxID=6943 RepID=A0AAQ4DSQ9_AMBAM